MGKERDMKRVFKFVLLVCLVLLWAAPAMAQGGGKSVDWSKKSMGRFLLEPGETISFTLPAGIENPIAGGFYLVPSPEAVGGDFTNTKNENLNCEGCKPTYHFTDNTPQQVTWTLSLKDKTKGGEVVYQNKSKGQVILH